MKKTTTKIKTTASKKSPAVASTAEPMLIDGMMESTAATRRNIAGTIERTDRFANIESGLTPFNTGQRFGDKSSGPDARDAIELCQKAYYNFSIFRNIIDLMTEFSISKLSFKNGSAKSREFFAAYYKKINIWDLQDKFYREYYRGGNVFLYRYSSRLNDADIKKITQVFGGVSARAAKISLPIRYVVLNPVDIRIESTVNFGTPCYYKTLNNYEIERLRHPLTDEDKELLQSLPENVQKQIATSGPLNILLPLLPENTVAIFYKKQDYEPFAIPMGFPALEDINAKCEMKRIDMAIARTMQQALLVVTAGNEPDKHGINPNNLIALQRLFENQSVSRVLVADYTTKAEFVIPQIADLLDPKKYEVLERDINIGLNNIFAGGEKFANQTAKMEVFIARLKQGREAFINNFLYPEVKRISKDLGFKVYPDPVFEEIDLKDDGVYAKIYSHLAEIGVLTPEETIKAIETNTLPDAESSIESQKTLKSLRENGLYAPINTGSPAGESPAGRPTGTPAPKTTSPIAGSMEAYSCSKLRQNLILAQEVEKGVIDSYKTRMNVTSLDATGLLVTDQIFKTIIANEAPEEWLSSIVFYSENPKDRNKSRVNAVLEISAKHDVDFYMASLLAASIK